MIITNTLIENCSKKTINAVISVVQTQPDKLEELVGCLFSNNELLSRNAAWVIGSMNISTSQKMDKYLDSMLVFLERPLHNGIKRNVLKLFQKIEIPDLLAGKVVNICFQLLNNKRETAAVQVFSMTVLGNLCKNYPDILLELKASISEQIPFQGPAFKARARKVYQKLGI